MLTRRSLLALAPAGLLVPRSTSAQPSAAQKLVAAAESQVGQTLHYDPAYTRLAYPKGDVPIEKGVCTDVVIRAYRQGLGIDLQQKVHEDMLRAFSAYPARWGLKKPDANIDHRRVPNLQTFFRRQKAELVLSQDAAQFRAGDIITMMLPGNLPHIALIADRKNEAGNRPLCVHNIGAGTQVEDVLFTYPLTGHYRYKV